MKKHIVLIEDEAGIRDNYRAAFERRGYRVSTYGDRPAAWQVLRQSLRRRLNRRLYLKTRTQ